MIASIRAEQKINADAFSLRPSQIANPKDNLENFATSSLVTIKTAGAGDCAFHASLGVWNETKRQFECKDAASERAKVAQAIAESKPGDAIFPLISASLKELIASGVNVGENIVKARASYQLYQQGYPQIVHCCWVEFEEELKNHIDIIKYMQQHASPKSKRLKEQFNDCESKDSDRFFRTLVASDPKLDKAYRHYQNACSERFVWYDILRNPSILREYAEFIGTPGKWLLPSELHIIAIALNITIKFYNVNAAVEIYNPHQDHVTAVYYNGANHYERIIASADLFPNMQQSVTNKGSLVRNIETNVASPDTIPSYHATLSSHLLPSQELASSVRAAFSDITTQGHFYAPTTHTTNHYYHYSISDLSEKKDIKPLLTQSKKLISSPVVAATAEDQLRGELKKNAEILKHPKETKQEIKHSSGRLAIGESDFKTMRENGDVLVDKTLLIKEIIDDRAKVKLIIRPRRFGKTLNMSMLKCFFEEKEGEDRSGLFKDLKICADKDYATRYQIHQGKYPVIFLTFKDIKATSFKKALEQFQGLFAGLYLDYEDVLNKTPLKRKEIDYCQKMINEEANETKTQQALKNLVNYLHRITNKKPIILIDEYDTPIHASYAGGYYKEMAEFMRGLLSPALKDNADLEQAILTGILRVAKESIFSGLNNIKVYSLLSERYSAYFGFSTDEVQNLLPKEEMPAGLMVQLEEWYGGYRSGKQSVMNPWSIVNFIEDNRDKSNGEKIFKLHWINTSENKLIEDMIQNHKGVIKSSFRTLVENKPIHQVLNEHTVFADIGKDAYSLWSFLLLNGYLTHGPDTSEVKDETATGQLVIPNREVFGLYEKHTKKWFSDEKLNFNFKNPFSQMIVYDWVVIRNYKNQVLNNRSIHAKLVFAEALIVHHRYIDADIINLIINSLDDSDLSIREAACDLIMKAQVAQFIRKNESLVFSVVAALLNLEVSDQTAEAALKAVFLPNEQCIHLLETSLDHAQVKTRVRAASVLAALGDREKTERRRGARAPEIVERIHERILAALLTVLHDSDSGVQSVAETAVRQLTPKNEASLSLLKAVLAHSNFRIRISAAARLIELGDRDKSLPVIFLAALQHSKWRIKVAGARALGEIGRADASTLPPLLSALHDTDSDIRRAAERAVQQLTPKNKTSLSLLQAALTHPQFKIQMGAAARLIELGDRDERLSTLSLAALKHNERTLRVAGVKALGEIGRADEPTLLGVFSAWHDADYHARNAAETAVQQLTPKNETSFSLLKALLEHPDFRIQVDVAARLAELGDRDERTFAILSAASRHSDYSIKEAGERALEKINRANASTLSPRFFEHRDVGAVAKTMVHSSIQENKAASSRVTGASSYSYEIMTSLASRNLDTRATSSQETSGVQVNPRTAYIKENEEEKPKRESGRWCVIS